MNVYVVATSINYNDLLTDQAKKDIQIMPRKALKWSTISNALPLQHNLTGPFYEYDSLVDVVSKAESIWMATGVISSIRNHIFAINRADAVFVWVDASLSSADYFDLAYAYASVKNIIVTALNKAAVLANPVLFEVSTRTPIHFYSDIKEAYINSMDGVQPNDIEKFVLLPSRFGGVCRGCGGMYGVNDLIMWSRKRGTYHKHCHDLNISRDAKEASMFSAELVKALQDRNAVLEQENIMLLAKCSAIERQLRGEGL